MLNEIGGSSNSSNFAKVQKGLSTYDAYSLMKNLGSKFSVNNLTKDSRKVVQKVDTERYSIDGSDEIEGYWQIYDKMLNKSFVFNPNTTTVQTNYNTDKNYIVSKDPFGGLMDVMSADSELIGALEQFLDVDSIPTVSLNENYTVDINEFTGIECLKVKGNEGGGSWVLISNEQQMEQLQELADVYKEKYPSLVKSDGVAMGLAEAEVAGLVVRTENGIMVIACNGLSYMDNAEPSKSWNIRYSINDTNMYTEIINAMADGYITGSDIEEVSKWEKYFKEKGLDFERILSDEELEVLVGRQESKSNSDDLSDDEESWWEKRHEKMEELLEEQEKEALKRAQAHRAQAQEIFLQSQLESQQRLQSFFMEKMQSEQGAVNMSAFQSASVSASAVSAYEDTISTFSKSVIESQKL